MAKTNDWGDEPAVVENPVDWGDKPAAQRDLPTGVKPSSGRSADDPRRLDRPADPIVEQGDPMGTGAAEIAAAGTPYRSVLEDQPAQPEAFDMRKASAAINALDDPRASAPSLRAGSAAPVNPAEDLGAKLSDASMPVRAGAKALTQGVQALAGGTRMVGDLTGARPVQAFGENAARNVDAFEKGMGTRRPVEGFGPNSPVPYLKDMAESAGASLINSAQLASTFGAKAVIPLMSIQSAGQQYDQARQSGLDPAAALANAVPYGIFEAVGEKFQGLDKAAGAMGVLLNKGASTQAKRTAADILVRAGVREIPGEVITYLGQTGVDLLPGISANPNMTVGDFLNGLRDTVVQAGMMGGTQIAGGHAARGAKPEPTAEGMARSKGFLATDEDRIKRLRAAGENEVADTLQRRIDTAAADRELQGLKGQAFHGPEFEQQYRTLRAAGVKPAEASARAAMLGGFAQMGGQAGLTPKAVQMATDAATKLPLDKVPGFLERYTAKLTAKGMGKPLPAGTVEGAITATGDHAMSAAIDTVYADSPKETADAITALEQKGATIPPVEAGLGAEDNSAAALPSVTGPASATSFDPGNDIALTPEADAVHQAATSPLNDLPEPTQAQKDAGNYKVGRLRIGGMDISIENPQGSTRRGTDADGNVWESPMKTGHYGYFTGTTANDGDKLDVFVKPGTPQDYSGPVFVVDQVNPKTGAFDEHKTIVGAKDQAEAEAIYRGAYDAKWNGLGAITQLPLPAFKAWAKSGTLKEPLGDISQAQSAAASRVQPAEAATLQPVAPAAAAAVPAGDRPTAEVQPREDGADRADGAPVQPDAALTFESLGATGTAPAGGRNARSRAYDANPFKAFIAKHGISLAERSEFAPGPTEQRKAMVPGYGPIFRRSGQPIDTLVQTAIEDGFLPQGEADGDTKLRAMIARVLAGERIIPQYAEGAAEREAQARIEAAREDDLADLTAEDLDDIGYSRASPEIQARVRELAAQLEDHGIDAETILEDSAKLTENATEQTYYEHALQALETAIPRPGDTGAQDRGQSTGASGAEAGRAAGEIDAGLQRAADAGADRGQRGAPGSREVSGPVRASGPTNTSGGADSSAKSEVAPLTWDLRPSGTLAIKGDPTAIIEKLAAGGVTKTMVMQGGIMVGKTQVPKALAILENKPAESPEARPLSVGIAPGSAEAVTVKNGIVYIGKAEAIDFDSGEPVKVKDGASDADIKQALKDAGALSRRQKFFGGRAEELTTDKPAEAVKVVNGEALTAPTEADVLAQQDRKENAAALDTKEQIDREAPAQTLTQPTAPEQRKDTTGDLLGGPSAQEALAAKKRADAAKAKPQQDDGTTPMFARGKVLSPEERSANFKRWSNDAPLVTSAAASTYEFKSGKKVVLEAFHGAKRPDRIGTVFKRQRATSGPMAFFTSAPELASSYAQGKDDTSLRNEDQAYENWFKYKPAGSRSTVDIARAWHFLSQEQRARIAELAPRVMFSDEQEDDGGNKIELGPEGHDSGTGGYDQHIKEARGNHLKALVEEWLSSANLFNDEERFLKVLQLAGFPMKEVTFDSPNAEYPSVYKTFVFMQKPLVTSDIPQDVRDALATAAKRDRSRAQQGGVDTWDKNTRTLREWVGVFNGSESGLDASYAWTSIPDKVTDVLKSLGYDGIIDWSGKGGGTSHPVYIPFEETQVKSATGNKGTFDRDKKDILFSRFDPARRQFVMGTAAALALGDAKAGVTIGKAAPISPAIMGAHVSPEVAKILRGNGATNPNGAGALRQALGIIAASGPMPVRALAKQIAATLPERGLMLTVDDKGLWNAHGAVTLHPIPHLQLFTAQGRTGLTYDTLLHESLHAAIAARYVSLSSGLIRSNDAVLKVGAPKASAAMAQFRALWEEFQPVAQEAMIGMPQDSDLRLSLKEARNSPDEFFVRALTDAKLQAFMASKRYEGKTLFERFKDWVKTSLLGFKEDGTAPSWLDAAIAAVGDLNTAMLADQADFSRLAAMGRMESQRSVMFHRAYHGSPHTFDKFSLDKIGTGEGAQAYGWGLYFAGKKEVAEHYRHQLSQRDQHRLTLDGKRVDPDSMLGRAVEDMKTLGKDAALQKLDDNIRFNTKYAPDVAEGYRNVRAQIEGLSPERISVKNGRLYEVEIPDEGAYLLWDKPLSEQPEAVKAALADYGAFDPELTGGEFYRKLVSDYSGEPEEVSKGLHADGIAGIKYLDGSSRHRPLRDVKREFLSELPEDADFNEVMDLIGSGTFSPANEAILKELAANDWLGFDYPAQAISAALGGNLSNYDASPALVKAVSDAQDGGTYNYVVFDDKAVKIEAMFRRGSDEPAILRVSEIRKALAPALGALKVPHAIHSSIAELKADTGVAIPDGVKGAYFKGKLHLVAESIRSPLEAESVFWHEVNHAGLDAMYGAGSKAYEDALRELAERNKNIRDAAKAWMTKYGHEDYLDRVKHGATHERALLRTKLQAVDEALAELSGRNAQISGLNRFIAKALEFMRSIGLNRLADHIEKLTDAQALSMILGARNAVMGNGRTVRSGALAPAFSKDETQFARQDTEAELKSLAEAATRPGNENRTVEIAPVSADIIAEAKEHGLDLTGYRHTADLFAVRHAFNKHGDAKAEVSRGQVAITTEDIGAIPGVIAAPDARVYGAQTSRKQPIIASIKHMPDGSTMVTQEVRTGQKTLALVSLRKYPAGKDTDSVARTLLSNARSDGGDGLIVVKLGESGQPASLSREDQRTVEVDGQRRPIENSAGQPIVPNHDMGKLRAFWRFFKGSKVTDEQGRPLVVYHGTDASEPIAAFKGEQSVGWFSQTAKRANAYAKRDKMPDEDQVTEDAAIYPSYLSISKPLVLDFDMNDDARAAHDIAGELGARRNDFGDEDEAHEIVNSARFMELARKAGYDGIMVREEGEWTFAPLSPNQIKSVYNKGTFDAENPNISFSRNEPAVISRQDARKHDFKTGEPVTVEALHGTPEGEIAQFKENERGLWFTDSAALADQYTMRRGMWRSSGDGAAIYPVHITMRNPLVIDALGKRNDNIPVPWAQWKPKVFGNLPKGAVNLHDALAYAKEHGHDGLIVRNVVDTAIHGDTTKSTVYAAVAPQQVKSALGGEEAPSFARGGTDLFAPDTWSAPEPTRTDKVIYELQDGRIDLKRVQEAIKKAHGEIPEKFDARQAETLYPGRVARRTELFLDKEVKPLLQAMARDKVQMDELADYLIARHAPERNAQIAKVNPDLPDGGAGRNSEGTLMTNDAAAAYLEAIPDARRAQLHELAQKVDAITRRTRLILVAEGLEKADTVAAWEGAYQNYVPLFKDEAGEDGHPHPQGMGFTVKGPASKRATGSTKQVTNVLAHVLMQREAVITRAEKNRVGLALYGLALSNPNPQFWTTIKPGMSNQQIGQELQAMGVDPTIAAAGMQGIPTIRTVDPLTQKVVDRPNPIYKNLPGAITLKVNGEDRVLMLNAHDPRALRMAEALKNLDGMTKLDIANSVVGKATRWIAASNTQYNPAFGLVNLTRDIQEGLINTGSTELKGSAAKILAQVPMALQGIARQLATDGGGEWGKLFKQFQDDGGRTGYREMFAQAEDRAKAIEKELEKAQRAGKLTPGVVGHAVLDLLDGFNTTLENAVRLSAYKTALDEGISRPRAATIARELTVDFNRKGRMGRELGPLYAFFNASVQGAERALRTLTGPTGAKVLAGGLMLGVIQALMLAMAGYDDDEVAEFTKTRAFIIPLPKKADGEKRYIAIPMPLGFLWIPNSGRVMTELTLNGGKDLGKRVFAAIGEITGSFSPFGGGNPFTADGALRLVAPTVVDPAIELGFNKNFAGTPIEKQAYRGETDNRPGYQRAKEATLRSTVGQAYLGISKAINALTGGNAYEAGLASPTPERLKYLAELVGGGVLREIEKTIDSSVKAARGEKVKMSGIPVAGRFYGEVDQDQVEQSRYFNKEKDIAKAKTSLQAAKGAGDGEAMVKMIEQHPELAMAHAFEKVQRELNALNKAAVSTVDDQDTIKAIDQARIEKMRGLNEAMKELEQASGKVTLGQKLRGAMRKPEVADVK